MQFILCFLIKMNAEGHILTSSIWISSTFGSWELPTLRYIEGSTSCILLVGWFHIARFWNFCVNHGYLVSELWLFGVSRTWGLGTEECTPIRILVLLCGSSRTDLYWFFCTDGSQPRCVILFGQNVCAKVIFDYDVDYGSGSPGLILGNMNNPWGSH